MIIHLRRTTPADIPFVCEVENAPENTPFIIPWSKDRHHNALDDPDILHMIAEKKRNRPPRRLRHHRRADQSSSKY